MRGALYGRADLIIEKQIVQDLNSNRKQKEKKMMHLFVSMLPVVCLKE